MKKSFTLGMLLTIVTFLTNGCSTGLKYPTVYHDYNKDEKYNTLNEPDFNKVATVEIGENIYSKSYLFFDNTKLVTLLSPAVGQGFGMSVNTTTSNSKVQGILRVWDKVGKKNIYSMCLTGTNVCLSDPNNIGSFTHFGVGAQVDSTELENPAKYEISPSNPIIKRDSFKYAALYQGKSKDSIKISFREFKDDMARPAFTQDIDYELAEDGTATVGFKGLRIQVLNATNLELTYRIIKDYD